MLWTSIDSCPQNRIVKLYRETDIYPVIGCNLGDGYFVLWEGGPEDGEHQKYPRLAYPPTHWKDVEDDIPDELFAIRKTAAQMKASGDA